MIHCNIAVDNNVVHCESYIKLLTGSRISNANNDISNNSIIMPSMYGIRTNAR